MAAGIGGLAVHDQQRIISEGHLSGAVGRHVAYHKTFSLSHGHAFAKRKHGLVSSRGDSGILGHGDGKRSFFKKHVAAEEAAVRAERRGAGSLSVGAAENRTPFPAQR